MELLVITFRTLFFYFFITFCYRVMGKREVGQLGIIDLIVSILIAELVAISIENTSDPIIFTIVPVLVLVLVEIVFGFVSLKSRVFRKIIQGRPTMIICDGKINYHQMIKQRYTIDDLLLVMRQNQIRSVEDIEYAFLESNGKLSIFPYGTNISSKIFPIPVIVDGKIDEEYFDKINLSKNDIYHMILNKGLEVENIFYGFYKNKKLFIIEKDNEKIYLNNRYITK